MQRNLFEWMKSSRLAPYMHTSCTHSCVPMDSSSSLAIFGNKHDNLRLQSFPTHHGYTCPLHAQQALLVKTLFDMSYWIRPPHSGRITQVAWSYHSPIWYTKMDCHPQPEHHHHHHHHHHHQYHQYQVHQFHQHQFDLHHWHMIPENSDPSLRRFHAW